MSSQWTPLSSLPQCVYLKYDVIPPLLELRQPSPPCSCLLSEPGQRCRPPPTLPLGTSTREPPAPCRRRAVRPHAFAAFAAAADRPPAASTPTAPALLAALGRGCASKLKVHDWAALWQLGRAGMKAAGVGARDRRCVLRAAACACRLIRRVQLHTVVVGEVPPGPRPGCVRAPGAPQEEDTEVRVRPPLHPPRAGTDARVSVCAVGVLPSNSESAYVPGAVDST